MTAPHTVARDLIKRLVELTDGDGWETADVLLEFFPIDQYGDASTSTNTGLHDALEAAEDALRKEYGIELKASTMRTYRATAVAWPREERSSRASYDAHLRLRGKNRHAEMDRYLKRNRGLPLSARHVQRYRADDNPKPPKAWDGRARQRIDSTVKSLLLGGIITKRPDWWNAGSAESREALIGMLRDLANRMEGSS